MKIIIAVVVVAVLGVTGLVMTKSSAEEVKTTKVEKIEKKTSVQGVADKLGAKNREYVYADMIGAKDGGRFTVGDTKVEIYEFESDKLEEGLAYLNNVPEAEVRQSDNMLILVHSDAETANTIMSKL